MTALLLTVASFGGLVLMAIPVLALAANSEYLHDKTMRRLETCFALGFALFIGAIIYGVKYA